MSYEYRDSRALHSFPTRRSSDLDGGMLFTCQPYRLEYSRPVGSRPECLGSHRGSLSRRHGDGRPQGTVHADLDRKSTRLNSSHANTSYAVFCLKKKNAPASSREQ